MDVDLFIKKMPQVVKELISREAFDNRRSINQEAIALLEEALLQRVGAIGSKRKRIEALLLDYADSGNGETLSGPTGLSIVPRNSPA